MRSRLIGLVLAVVLGSAGPAAAQWFYPGGYGGWGWSQWGVSPNAGYMAALGSYAQGQGVYDLKLAQARAIDRESILKWNKAMMAQRRVEEAERARREAARRQRDAEEVARDNVLSGYTLNDLLHRILEFNPDGLKAARAKAPLSPELIRDIPFTSATEAVTVCLDQLTGLDDWPVLLQADVYAAPRAALREAVTQALREDREGPLQPKTVEAIKAALAELRAAFVKNATPTQPGYDEADEFLRTFTGVLGLLKQPDLKRVLAELEGYEGGTVGDLIGFMHAFNLKFAPAESDRQQEIYQALVPMFEQVLNDVSAGSEAPAPAPGDLAGAARGVFKGFHWKDIEAHQKAH